MQPYTVFGDCGGYSSTDVGGEGIVKTGHGSIQYATYTEGLGLSFLWGVSGKDTEQKWQVTAYINGGDTVGVFNPAIDWAVGIDHHPDRSFTLNPNPVQNQLNLSNINSQSSSSWKIINLYGQTCAEGQHSSGASSSSIDVTSLDKGFYNFLLLLDNDQYTVQKFVKL